MIATRRVNELGGNAQPLTAAPHATFDHIVGVQLAGDLPHVDRLTFVTEGAVARDHPQPAVFRQRGDNVFGHAVSEIFLIGVARHVVERQNGDRGFFRHRRRRFDARDRCGVMVMLVYTIRSHGFGNVFHFLRSEIVELNLHNRADMFIDIARDTDAAGFCQTLHARCCPFHLFHRASQRRLGSPARTSF